MSHRPLEGREPTPAADEAQHCRPPADGSRGTLVITGYEADLLLSLLDRHIADLPRAPETRRLPDPALTNLRKRLFLAHEHPPEDDEP